MLRALFQDKMQTLPKLTAGEAAALEKQFLNLLTHATFRFQTFNQARQLAYYLSHLCPNPSRTAVGLTELFLNGIEHGNLGITFEEKNNFATEQVWLTEVEKRQALTINQKKWVTVEVNRHPRNIEFIIQDEGRGFEWEKFTQENNIVATAKNGRGILLAKLMSFDELYYLEPGNTVTGIVHLKQS